MTENVAEQLDMALSLGQLLKGARERLNLTQEDVAEHLRLTKDVIDHIESDHFDKAGYSVFVRGYIRSYAKYVNVSSTEVETFFQSLGVVEKPKPVKQAQFMIEKTSAKRKKSMRWISVGIVAVLIILALIWLFWQRSSAPAPVAPTPVPNSSLVSGDHAPVGNNQAESLSAQFAKKKTEKK